MGNKENKDCSTDASCCTVDGTRTMKDVSEIKKSAEGVLVNITAPDVKAENIENIITSCQTGQCDCMSPDVKKKITGMEFINANGKLGIAIKGDISEAEIKEAMNNSVKKV
jgi:hypothetical protein